MEIRTEPYFLEIQNIETLNCPRCNDVLVKQIKHGKYLINGECSYCTYQDRPFATASPNWHHRFPDGCTCEYSEKEFMYVTCNSCLNPKCMLCKNYLDDSNKYKSDKICSICREKQRKEEFNKKWKTLSIKDKLELYGIKKLRLLAKKKNIKGYSKHNKNDLIKILFPYVGDNDFPIK